MTMKSATIAHPDVNNQHVTMGEALALLDMLASLVERLAFGTPEQTSARDLALEAEKLFNREVSR